MKKIFLLVAVAVVSLLFSYECRAQYDSLKFGDYGVASVSALSFTSVRGSVWIEVGNPQTGFTVSEVEGKLYKNGVALIEGHADDYYVPNGDTRITLTGVASLCPGVSILEVLGLILFEPELYTVDIKAVITDDGGDPVVNQVKNIPVLTLLKKEDLVKLSSHESKNSK